MYAIIEDKGRQFKVTTGDTILLDRPGESEGEKKTITFDRVLLIGGDGAAKIGAPTVAGATVSADIVREAKGKKVRTVKYSRRKGYHKEIGHRQKYLSVKITGINV
jgi:large subunit ribosomal protein L21